MLKEFASEADVLQLAEGMNDLDVFTSNDERDELRQDVALMRELGVSAWKTIVLGSPPLPRIEREPQETQPSRTPEQIHQELRDERRRIARLGFGGPLMPLGSRHK